MTENPTLPSPRWEGFRFFLFQYEKEIRVFLITTLLLGGFVWGKSSIDHWQVNRFDNWSVVTATILEAEVINKPSSEKYRTLSTFRFQAVVKVEYRTYEEWIQEKVWISEIPLKDLKLLERGREIQLRIRPEKPTVPIFRWQDQILREPTG